MQIKIELEQSEEVQKNKALARSRKWISDKMKNPNYWKEHYVVRGDADEIERNLKSTSFISGGKNFELIYFEKDQTAPNVLISEGSGGHARIFAELGYEIHSRGYNVFIMPKHGGATISELVARHQDALEYIKDHFNENIGVFAEGLGGFAVFYLALTDGIIRSAVYQNSPAIITDPDWRRIAAQGKGLLLSFAKLLAKISPDIPLPISAYLNWKKLIDPERGNREIENRLVVDGYLKDPDFDRWYPLSAVLSLMATPPPRPLTDLKTPTLFMVASRGFGGAAYAEYLKKLYERLPSAKKKLIEVDGSVYWILSHPKEAAEIICGWFGETI